MRNYLISPICKTTEAAGAILVAEDNRNDIQFLRRALAKTSIAVPVRFVSDAKEIIAYLQGAPPFDNPVACPAPSLLLLDLKLRWADGLDVLRWLRSWACYKDLKVIAFAGSGCRAQMDSGNGASPRSEALAAEPVANFIIEKPADWDGFAAAIDAIVRPGSHPGDRALDVPGFVPGLVFAFAAAPRPLRVAAGDRGPMPVVSR